jgi:hypothetical protein
MGSIAAEQHSPLPPPQHHQAGGGGGGLVVARPTRCLLLLQGCLAVKLQRVSNLVHPHHPAAIKQGHEFWMYDSGYRLFQVRLILFPFLYFAFRKYKVMRENERFEKFLEFYLPIKESYNL